MTDKFIEKAREVHGDKYDYSKTVYITSLKEVIIICNIHGEFLQLPKTHKRGNGCIQCGRERTSDARKSNVEEFIEKSNEVHNNKYDYSKVDYKKAREKVIIICIEHGEFLQTPNSHLGGTGCRNCSTQRNSDNARKTKEEFIKESIEVHGFIYDYSKVEYKNTNENVIIICKEHGEFEQTPSNHLRGTDCRLCSIIKGGLLRRKTTEEFICECIKIHGYKYDYSNTEYVSSLTPIKIICKEHGEFIQNPQSHLTGNLCCPICLKLIKGKWNSSNTNEFIKKAIKIHGDTYDYSSVIYISAIDYINIGCKIHGIFIISPNSHLNGSGCNKCGIIKRAISQSFTTEQFIEKSNEIYGTKYDYSQVEYVNNHTLVSIICKEHGMFEQTPQGHLSGRKCIKCSNRYHPSSKEWILKAICIHGEIYDYSKVEYVNAHIPIIIICKIHGEFKQAPVVHLRPTGCNKCSGYKKHSNVQIRWLNFIQSYKKIYIQHAENGGEFSIPETRFKADGYCKETNTIYEFHGDLWHGNPKVFKPEDVSFFGTTYGELYKKTLEKEEIIKALGFNLVVMWESDWKRIINSINILKRKFKTV